jgi:hypothetical protein
MTGWLYLRVVAVSAAYVVAQYTPPYSYKQVLNQYRVSCHNEHSILHTDTVKVLLKLGAGVIMILLV